jgi:predicted transposase YbfD/YdcC
MLCIKSPDSTGRFIALAPSKRTVMVVANREKAGVVSEETRFYLSSVAASPKAFNGFVRNHWNIENTLQHFFLPVTTTTYPKHSII